MPRSTNARADRCQGRALMQIWGMPADRQPAGEKATRRAAGGSAPAAPLPPMPPRRGWLRPPCA